MSLTDNPAQPAGADQAAVPAVAPDLAPAPGPEPEVSAPVPPASAQAQLEAILMVIDQPASTTDLAIAIGQPVAATERLLIDLANQYRGHGPDATVRGFELREVGGGWRIYSHPEHAAVVERFVREGLTTKLTQAALETLAIVAYKGPISRGRISAVRGVNVESVMRTLVSRGLVEEVGFEEDSGAVLYATTALFLERMGMTSLDELEPLAPHLPSGPDLAELTEQIEA
ncbi:MAG: SMC-Scp complex subunit ScpB [Bifidobacteriaceae bacterium]|jgi:segregation and condensation protein B|nr:SMC-Scp complex subunit ScpB [Bifidobacteriaceae bacterium]